MKVYKDFDGIITPVTILNTYDKKLEIIKTDFNLKKRQFNNFKHDYKRSKNNNRRLSVAGVYVGVNEVYDITICKYLQYKLILRLMKKKAEIIKTDEFRKIINIAISKGEPGFFEGDFNDEDGHIPAPFDIEEAEKAVMTVINNLFKTYSE